MKNKVDKQINNINESLAWIKRNNPDDYKVKFINLVEQRRRLKVVKRASADNPAIAAFGISQVGKSYLMSCILQKRDSDGSVKQFKVNCGGNEYDFIKEINPIGDGKEATGVVTRFSSFKRKKGLYSEEYPALVRCLSLIDVVTLLCDTYFLDLCNFTTPSESEIKLACEELVAKYSSMPDIASAVITADDILGMKQYFKKYINNAQVFVDKCSFFSEIALIIEKVPVNEYINVFKYLWNCDDNISKLFLHLQNILRKMDFAEYVYLPIDAVLHNGIKDNTVMSVECLKHLLDSSNTCVTDVYVRESATMKKLGQFTKSEICAVAAEVIYKIDEELLESKNKYCLDGITETVKAQINKNDVEMSILNDNDLLDFPGARSRLSLYLSNQLDDKDLLNCLLRGKIAYLFNKYNEALLINVLLYCHHDTQNDVTHLWHLLQEWVRNNVGDTVEKRKATLDKTKISPLFYVATMFNKDMKYRDSAVENNENSITARWKGRFDTVLNNQCLMRESVEWVKNWCANGNFFKNSYLLRDFKYSDPDNSRLYDGFKTYGEEKEMIIPMDYYNTMRDTFVKNTTVKELFESPEIAWDLATTKNNDGSLYIIENLKIVASLLDAAREQLFSTRLQDITSKVLKEISGYYVSTDKTEILNSNIRKARNVFRELSFTCNLDNYYFGHLIQALQVTESSIYKLMHEQIMQNPELLTTPNNFDKYEIIRKDCENNGFSLENSKSEKDLWNALIQTYAFISKEDAEDFLHRKGVDYKLLFDFENCRCKSNSDIIADYIYDAWCDNIKSVSFIDTFTSENSFNNSVMTNFIDNIIETSKRIKLNGIIADAIAEYVNVVDVHIVNENFIADIIADIINDYILDFGYSTYDDEKKKNIREVAEAHNLPIYKYIDKDDDVTYTDDMLTELFNSLSSNPMALIPSFEENYYKWIEYMYISYIAHLEVPYFDVEANSALKGILESMNGIIGKAV